MTRPRTYDNSRREEAARETRMRILQTAGRLLLDGGYHAMTVASLAKKAGVSPQTVYNSVGGKAEVVKAVYDILLAGDEEPIPMSQRPAFRAMNDAQDARTFVTAYARWSRQIYEGVGPLLGTLLAHGSGGDATLESFVATIEQERRTGNTHTVTALRRAHGLPRGMTTARAIDSVWTLTAPEIADRLVRRRGWSLREYERWLAAHLLVALT